MENEPEAISGRTWALLIARVILGLTFFMAGVWKVFSLGPVAHAQGMFVDGFANTFLPAWSLWVMGTTIPVVELVAGGLVILGLFRRPALVALGGVLVVVTFGHLLTEPLYSLSAHIFPRTVLLLFVLSFPAEQDRFSVDQTRGR